MSDEMTIEQAAQRYCIICHYCGEADEWVASTREFGMAAYGVGPDASSAVAVLQDELVEHLKDLVALGRTLPNPRIL